jgi:hypothetical protein
MDPNDVRVVAEPSDGVEEGIARRAIKTRQKNKRDGTPEPSLFELAADDPAMLQRLGRLTLGGKPVFDDSGHVARDDFKNRPQDAARTPEDISARRLRSVPINSPVPACEVCKEPVLVIMVPVAPKVCGKCAATKAA